MTTSHASIALSQRVRQLSPSSTLAVSARVRELRAAGRDVIGFGAGEPDFDTPMPIKQASIDALLAGATRYQPIPGTPEAREVIAEKLRRENGISCTAEHIVVNAGAKHSVYLALQALVDPGDEVVVPTPAWVSYVPMIGLCGGVPVDVPGTVESEFKITPRQLDEAITRRTRVIILNSPSNPCGTMYSPAEIGALAEVVARHDHVVLISDEIYEKIIFGGFEHRSPGSIDAIADRVITINGLSKAYAMTGWRIGYVCAPGGDGAIAKAVAKLQGQMNSHIAASGFAALIEAITNGDEAVEEMRRAFASRGALMHRLLTDLPDVRCPIPTGAFYAFPDVSAYYDGTTPDGRPLDSAVTFATALLEEAEVAVVPGTDFGGCGDRHVRLSFACSDDQIEEGCRRIGTWLATLR